MFSSIAEKKISAPFSSLNQHIGAIAERNFGKKIDMPVYDELQDFVNNINAMSEKLENVMFYKGKKGNFGLGLAISKNVIERHNRKITAENSGSGALFVIELPLIDS